MAKTLSANKPPSFGRILERLNKLPPFFIYYAGGRGGTGSKNFRRRTSLQKMSEVSGIPKRTFTRIAWSLSFDNVKAKYIDPFLRACGVDPFCNEILHDYISKTMKSKRPFSHLNKRQLKHFELLMTRYLKMLDDKKDSKISA